MFIIALNKNIKKSTIRLVDLFFYISLYRKKQFVGPYGDMKITKNVGERIIPIIFKHYNADRKVYMSLEVQQSIN